jgi:3-phosphoshikimate 1-carboxyvinyltransferase
MKVLLLPGGISGEISAIPSKSHLHRLLIYAALADRDSLISCNETEAEDIHATIDCLSALGAVIGKNEGGFAVTPIDRRSLPVGSNMPVLFPCGESGSTLRFLLPVVTALGIRGAFEMKGRLPERPLSPLDTQLENHGVKLWRDTPDVLQCKGQLKAGDDYTLPGDVSSQYISGLMMALPLLNKASRLAVTTPVESSDYIEMTLDAAGVFRNQISTHLSRRTIEYEINIGVYKSPGCTETEGDWSNGAFWLCAGAMPGGNISLGGLRKDSSQGDREIFNILQKMGTNISWIGNNIQVSENKRHLTEIDGSAIPDLIPVLAAVASVGDETTVFRNCARLRLKESDRLQSTARTLSALGANIKETPDGLIVKGAKSLHGGEVDAHGDHRIAMMAAIASAACTRSVTITGAQAVNKSYPTFWRDLALLGKKVRT